MSFLNVSGCVFATNRKELLSIQKGYFEGLHIPRSDTSPVTIVEKGSGSHYFTGGFLNVGESGTISIYKTGSTPLTSTGTYTLTFVTERGNIFTSYYPRTSRFQSSLAYTFQSMRTRYAWSASGGTITYAAFNAIPWQNASVPYGHLSDMSNSLDFNMKTISGRPNYYAWQI